MQEQFSVTLRVMRVFSVLPGAPRACMFFRDPTDVSGLTAHYFSDLRISRLEYVDLMAFLIAV